MRISFVAKNWRHWIRRIAHAGPGGRIEVGAFTYGAPRILWWGDDASLSIGKYCSIADDVEIALGGNHRVDWVTTYPFPALRGWREAKSIQGHPTTRGNVIIRNDVWLGRGCTVLSGVTIGNGAVCGSRAIVTHDVPDYAIVAGNPAKIVKMRFDAETINRLVSLQWWNWDPSKIRRALPDLLSPDIQRFLQVYESSSDN
ncbi:MAG: CatB-related O-acetyltransferase [Bryobacteraceae bacterium]